MLVAAGASAERFSQWARALGARASVLRENLPAGVLLFHLDAPALLSGETGGSLRLAFDSARRAGALVSVDLGPAGWVREHGGPRTAYQLAALRPDIIFASSEAGAEVGAPLEGLASVPVLMMGVEGCRVCGKRLVAPPGIEPDAVGFMAAFCVALVSGIAPVEAAGRAVLAAAGGLVSVAEEVPAG